MKTMTTGILPRMPRPDTDQSRFSGEGSEIGSIHSLPRIAHGTTDQPQFRVEGSVIDPCRHVLSVVKFPMDCMLVPFRPTLSL